VLRKIDSTGYDLLVCLGDISGFSVPYYDHQEYRDASGSLALLKKRNAVIVPGNHDYHAVKRIPVASDVFDFPDNWYELDYPHRKAMAGKEIWLHDEDELDPLYSHEDIRYLNLLPEYYIHDTGTDKILFSHYLYPNLAGFKRIIYRELDEFMPHFQFMERLRCNISFTGHTHNRGFYVVTKDQYRQHRFSKEKLKELPVIVNLPPVANNKNSSGFGIFDTDSLEFRAIRQ
jgi:predicted phosphodiesterase